MRLYRKLAAFIMALVLLGMVSCFAEEGETRILVIETTDIHGCIFDASSGDPATFQYRMARIARGVMVFSVVNIVPSMSVTMSLISLSI